MKKSVKGLAMTAVIVAATGCGSGQKSREQAPSTSQARIEAGSANLEAVLGSAYQSEKQAFVGSQCIAGDVPFQTGKADSGFTLQETLSEAQAASELGFGMNTRLRYGVAEFNAAANFYSNSVSNNFSVSAIYEASYRFPVLKLSNPRLSDVGRAVSGNDERWATTCGDEFVSEVIRGAKLFYSIRLDFQSEEQKREFQAKFSVSGPMFGFGTNLSEASRHFSKNTKVTVSAYQIGGDVSKLTKIFGDSEDARTGFTQCTLGSFEQCAKVLSNALAYAADTQTGFPSQLTDAAKPGPAIIAYNTTPYTAIGIYPTNYPHLTEAIKLARSNLSDLFEHQYRLKVTGDRMLKGQMDENQRLALKQELTKLNTNITALLAVSQTCYEQPKDCPQLVLHDMKLQSVDESVFKHETFSDLCTKGLSLPADDPLHDMLNRMADYVMVSEPNFCASLETKFKSVTKFIYRGEKGSKAADLRPLSYFKNLRELYMGPAHLPDISPLSELENLEYLAIGDTDLSDISALQNLTALQQLLLGNNQIRDICPLMNLQNLKAISLLLNHIQDVSCLSGFPELVYISLGDNPVPSRQIKELHSRIPQRADISTQSVYGLDR